MPQFEQVSVFGSLIFWSVISFAILFFMLKKFAFPPILAALDDREKKIRGDIEQSEKLFRLLDITAYLFLSVIKSSENRRKSKLLEHKK